MAKSGKWDHKSGNGNDRPGKKFKPEGKADPETAGEQGYSKERWQENNSSKEETNSRLQAVETNLPPCCTQQARKRWYILNNIHKY